MVLIKYALLEDMALASPCWHWFFKSVVWCCWHRFLKNHCCLMVVNIGFSKTNVVWWLLTLVFQKLMLCFGPNLICFSVLFLHSLWIPPQLEILHNGASELLRYVTSSPLFSSTVLTRYLSLSLNKFVFKVFIF